MLLLIFAIQNDQFSRFSGLRWTQFDKVTSSIINPMLCWSPELLNIIDINMSSCSYIKFTVNVFHCINMVHVNCEGHGQLDLPSALDRSFMSHVTCARGIGLVTSPPRSTARAVPIIPSVNSLVLSLVTLKA